MSDLAGYKPLEYVSMRLVQIASGDWRVGDDSAELIAMDALKVLQGICATPKPLADDAGLIKAWKAWFFIKQKWKDSDKQTFTDGFKAAHAVAATHYEAKLAASEKRVAELEGVLRSSLDTFRSVLNDDGLPAHLVKFGDIAICQLAINRITKALAEKEE